MGPSSVVYSWAYLYPGLGHDSDRGHFFHHYRIRLTL